MTPRFGVVILTMGTRPDALKRAVESVRAQQQVTCDIAVVGNGWKPIGLPDGVACVHLPTNLGIPAGRNAGVPHVSGEMLFFLDDDAELASTDFLAQVARRFAHDPTLGLLQPRIDDPTGIPSPRRWVPRLRVGDPKTPGPAMALAEAAVAIPRQLFDDVGGWPENFFYAHEGVDLVWRVWDAGFVCWYAGDMVAYHPVVDPARHQEYYRLNARNRVWLARRNLPAIMEPIYLGTWVGMTLLRMRDKQALRAWFGGFRDGWVQDAGPRKPMRWKTVWRMTKAGRPPVI